ncbi:hypothetical protein BGZ47_010752 [Haplosporangium gracile]|nr:hypothetical protein BGZ47_010752 [Haplosporangium gracile]
MDFIPSLELNLIKSSIQKAGTSLSDVKLGSISKVLTALSAMEGPDDSLKRPHSLVDDDEYDKKDTSSSKTNNDNNHGRKRQRHRSNDRRGKGKATAVLSFDRKKNFDSKGGKSNKDKNEGK